MYKWGYETMKLENLEGINKVLPEERIIGFRTGRQEVIGEGEGMRILANGCSSA